MTEVLKPGANSKVASVPYLNSKLPTVSYPRFLDFFFHTFVTLSNFEVGLEVPKASGKLQK